MRMMTQVEIGGRRYVMTPVELPLPGVHWLVVFARLDGTEPVVTAGVDGGYRCSCRKGLRDRQCEHTSACMKAGYYPVVRNEAVKPAPAIPASKVGLIGWLFGRGQTVDPGQLPVAKLLEDRRNG